jgi:hypothetical protein
MGREFIGRRCLSERMGFGRGVLFLENCEGTCNWIATGTGGNDWHGFTTTAAFRGKYGVRLKTRTTAPEADDWVQMARTVSYPESGLLVLRLRWSVLAKNQAKWVVVGLVADDGNRRYEAFLRLSTSASVVHYGNAAGGFTQIGEMSQTFVSLAWYAVELVIDCRAHQWIEVIFGGVRKSLAGVALYDAGATAGRGTTCLVRVTTREAGPAEVVVDDVYVGELLEV